MGAIFRWVKRIFNSIIYSDNIVYSVYPVTAGKQTAGKAIPSKAAANEWGSWTPVIATGDITTEFWYVGTQLFSVGVAGEDGAVQIGYTDGTGPPPALKRQIDEIEWRKFTAVDTDLGMPLSRVPYPVRLPAKAEVSARSATLNAASKNVTISIKVATGL